MKIKFGYSTIRAIYITLDAVFCCLSIYLACQIRQGALSFPISFSSLFLDRSNPFQILFFLWVVVILFCAYANDLYQTRRESFEGIEIWMVAKCVFISSIMVIVANFALKVQGFPRSILFLGTVFMVISLSLWRIFKKIFVQYLVARGYNTLNVLIVGAGRVGQALAQEIEQRPHFGLKVVGFLDDFKYGDPQYEGKVLGKVPEFAHIAQREFVNKVFITIHHDYKIFLQLIEEAKNLGVAVRVVPQGFDVISGELVRYNIGVIPVLEYCDLRNLKSQAGKRIFDIGVSFILLLVLAPIFLAIAIKIKLDSNGPVFYRSKRYGQRGKIFYMLKFRSMVLDADRKMAELRSQNEVDGPIFKIRNDPRITQFGKFLRKYSLDELPQLINVLKGEMSLVGPRPLPIDQIEREDLRQFKRLEVKSGITGLWQVRGRSDVPFSRLIKWDIWYIKNWSFLLDLNILLQTIPVILKGKGAY
jgi:exopolysaccharide biosynthesis polyprenyl glycosylphosphotransferase